MLLALFLQVVCACAVTEKFKAKTAGKEPVAVRGPSVARLEGGREGFIITEVPAMDEAARKDFERAVTLMNEQENDQAIQLLEKVIALSPGVSAPYIDLAMAYRRTGRPEAAEAHLKTALNLFPHHPVASNEYALLCRKAGRFSEARELYEKALEKFPEYYPAHRNLGILCDLYLQDPACAMAHYHTYSQARPEDKQVQL
jgi:Tfp pilus assembly protein PilF